MSLFAPVAPPHLLRRMKEPFGEEILGKYHLVLAHDVAANKEAWTGLLPQGSTVIIDNSIIELGAPVEPLVMLDALSVFDSSYRRIIVLPDTFDDWRKTSRESMSYWNLLKPVVHESVEFLYVIQGDNLGDIDAAVSQAEYFICSEMITWIAVPRRICNNLGTRMYALLKVLELKLQHPHIKIHLMGFSNNIQDDILCAHMWGVEGIDSAVPLRLGQRGTVISLTYEGDQAGPRGTFWEDPHDRITVETRLNMQRVRRSFSTFSIPPLYVPKLKRSTDD